MVVRVGDDDFLSFSHHCTPRTCCIRAFSPTPSMSPNANGLRGRASSPPAMVRVAPVERLIARTVLLSLSAMNGSPAPTVSPDAPSGLKWIGVVEVLLEPLPLKLWAISFPDCTPKSGVCRP